MTTERLPAITDDEAERKRKGALLKAIGLDKVPPEQRELALAIAKRYELDLLLKHLVLIDGRPYITRDGLLWVAHRSGQLDGIEVTDPEVVTLAGAGDFWRASCSVYRKDMSRPFTYAGRYPTKGGNQRFAPEMAVKVAEVMALRRAFNVSAPVLEERWDMDMAPDPTPRPDIRDQVEAKLGEVVDRIAADDAIVTTSGFDASGGAVTVGQESGPDAPGLVVDAVPAPADHAGARAGTSRQDASDPDAGATEAHSEPTPAPRCDGFSKELGACVRPAGHTANHQAKDGQSWA